MTTNTMGRDEAGKAIRKRAMEGCPLARELLILRGMCSCQGDEKSVDDAEDRYLELAALTQAEQPEAGRIADQKKGLYRKYRVERLDGSSGPGGKHEHCDYFVLDLVHDKFAQPALRAYASACAAEYPALAADLMQKAGGEEPTNAEAVMMALDNGWLRHADKCAFRFKGCCDCGLSDFLAQHGGRGDE